MVLNIVDLPYCEPEALERRNKGHYEQEMAPSTIGWSEVFFKPHKRRLYEYLDVDSSW